MVNYDGYTKLKFEAESLSVLFLKKWKKVKTAELSVFSDSLKKLGNDAELEAISSDDAYEFTYLKDKIKEILNEISSKFKVPDTWHNFYNKLSEISYKVNNNLREAFIELSECVKEVEKEIEQIKDVIDKTSKLPRPFADNNKDVVREDELTEEEKGVVMYGCIKDEDYDFDDVDRVARVLDALRLQRVITSDGINSLASPSAIKYLEDLRADLYVFSSSEKQEQVSGNNLNSLFNDGSEKGKTSANDKQKLDS